MKRMLTIWIADASPLFREGLKHVLRRPRYLVQRMGATLAEILDFSMTPPNVIILGSSTEPDLEGLIERLRMQSPPAERTRFILLYGDCNGVVKDRKDLSLSALKCLVDAILPRNMPSEALPHFVEIAMLEQPVFIVNPERSTVEASTDNPDIFLPPRSRVADPEPDLSTGPNEAPALYHDRQVTLSERERDPAPPQTGPIKQVDRPQVEHLRLHRKNPYENLASENARSQPYSGGNSCQRTQLSYLKRTRIWDPRGRRERHCSLVRDGAEMKKTRRRLRRR
jgi:DNA-binding NarL/FixJ family response regulator